MARSESAQPPEGTPNPSSHARTPRPVSTVRFHSILFDRRDDAEEAQEPECFTDLNLDQVVEAIVRGRDEYDLEPFFYAPLRNAAAVQYRQAVFRDVERRDVADVLERFADALHAMRRQLAQAKKLHYERQKQHWFLDAAQTYCQAVESLGADLETAQITSAGLRGFREYLRGHTRSQRFRTLAAETRGLLDELSPIRYAVQIRGDRVRVSTYACEPDYSTEVEETFAKFKQAAVSDYRVSLPDWPDMNHVEAQILDCIAQLYPQTFAKLQEFPVRHRDYLDPTIARFDREVQVYLAYLEFLDGFREADLPFCYPEVSSRARDIAVEDAFDIALATKLDRARGSIVRNDFRLSNPERIIVVTGPNQGGKTTFARMVGQLHYLAGLGFPVPGASARLLLPDQVFTHFEREEDVETLRGKLDDELVRIHEILEHATSNSVIVMNESFGSTTLHDALVLGTRVLKQIIDRRSLAVCVTFVDELASLTKSTVSMVAQVVPENPSERTFKVVRKPADGLAYASAIAEKYGLTYATLKRRIAR